MTTAYNILAKSLIGRRVLVQDSFRQIMRVVSIRGWGWETEEDTNSGIDIEVRLKGSNKIYKFSIDDVCK